MEDPDGHHGRGGSAAKAAAACFLVSAVLLLLGQMAPSVQHVTQDELTYVYDSMRVANGAIPYLDFFNFTPPGTFYLLAPPVSVWEGKPVTAARAVMLLTIAMAWTALYLGLRVSAWSRGSALLASAMLPVCIWPFAPFTAHHVLALGAFSVFSLAAAHSWKSPDSGWAWLSLGAAAALAGWFLQSEGVFALAAGALGSLASWGPARSAWRRFGLCALAGAVTSVVLWAPILLHGALGAAAYDVVVWPGTHYAKPGNVNDAPILSDWWSRVSTALDSSLAWPSWSEGVGGLGGVLLYVALPSAAVFLVCRALVDFVAVASTPRRSRAAVLSAGAVTLLAIGGWTRANPNWVHLMYALPPGMMLYATAWDGRAGLGQRGHRLAAWALTVVLCAGFAYHGRALWGSPPAPRGWLDVDRGLREGELNRWIRSLTFLGKGDTVAVLPAGADVYLYTYPAATGYTYLFPFEDRLHDIEDHRIVAAELLARRPKLVVVHRIREGAFLREKGPVAEVLSSDYIRWTENPAIVVYLLKTLPEARSPGGAVP